MSLTSVGEHKNQSRILSWRSFPAFFDKRRMEWHVYFLRFLIDFTTAISIGGKYPYSIFGPGSLPQY